MFNVALTGVAWLAIVPQSKRLQVQFLVRHMPGLQVWSPFGGIYERQPIPISLAHQCVSPSLSPFLPLSLKINK